jgi:hypothetical protein
VSNLEESWAVAINGRIDGDGIETIMHVNIAE